MSRLDILLARTRAEKKARDSGDYARKAQLISASCHPKQRAFVEDPARRVAALVARGGGKTTGAKGRYGRRMLLTDRARCIYFAATREDARELMWAPLKDMFDELEVEYVVNETRSILKLPRNGSQVRLVGMDDQREVDKQRGKPFHEVGIDEAASHDTDLLKNLLFRVIGPRLGDYGGCLWMVGTPGHVLLGEFYEVTRPGSTKSRPWDKRDLPEYADWKKWSTHHWTLQDGAPYVPAMARLWQEALIEKEANGWSDDNPIWRREYLGLWAADDTENVYRYRAYTEEGDLWNAWRPGTEVTGELFGLPEGHEWRFVYGMDLGHADPFALVILAYSMTSKICYVVYEYTRTEMTVTEVAELLKEKILLTGWPDAIVADTAGLGDMVIAELATTHGLAVEAAEKKNKFDAIELANADFVDGLLRIPLGSELEKELVSLQWEVTDSGKLKEKAKFPNHLCDAMIYARRRALHRHAAAPPPKPRRGTPEGDELQMLEDEAAAAKPVDEIAGYLDDNNLDRFFDDEGYFNG